MMSLLASPGALANAAIALIACILLLVRLVRAWRRPLPVADESRDFFINFVLATILIAAILGMRVFLVGDPKFFTQVLPPIVA